MFAYAAHIPYTLPLEAAVQDKIENRVRDPLGRYLGEVVKPGETIVTEPSGYFGYYTNATLLHYPGLTSTRVTDRLRERAIYPLVGLVVEFEPDSPALRQAERARIASSRSIPSRPPSTRSCASSACPRRRANWSRAG